MTVLSNSFSKPPYALEFAYIYMKSASKLSIQLSKLCKKMDALQMKILEKRIGRETLNETISHYKKIGDVEKKNCKIISTRIE